MLCHAYRGEKRKVGSEPPQNAPPPNRTRDKEARKPRGSIPWDSPLGKRLLVGLRWCEENRCCLYIFPEVGNLKNPDLLDIRLAGRKLFVAAPHLTHGINVHCPTCHDHVESAGFVKYFRRYQEEGRTNFAAIFEYRCRDCEGEEEDIR